MSKKSKTYYIDTRVADAFDNICETEGWKKSKRIEVIMALWIKKQMELKGDKYDE